MLVFANHRLGPAAELLVSRDVATTLLMQIADAARSIMSGHWEHELVRWLDEQVSRIRTINEFDLAIDVAEIAFTPQHFERQRRFLTDAIARASKCFEDARPLAQLSNLIQAHPRDSVQFGRRWQWRSSN
jgi:hypothetical protein